MPLYQRGVKVTLFGLSKPVADEQRRGKFSVMEGAAPVHQWREMLKEKSEGPSVGPFKPQKRQNP
ncbi:hypothetical protein, partial [Pseudomonas sp. B329]|uniref:hypothetical protein n=1 Tax=Pseudomonas sp. B329 TaxID=1553459 RepID=UPI002002CEA0